MCFCESKYSSYEPFYDGRYFSDGERCTGIVFHSGDSVTFESLRDNGELHERGDELPIFDETIVAENATKQPVCETKPPVTEKWTCENCNAYKPAEIKKHGEIYACNNCRRKLDESATEKAQMSLFWEQGRLF